MQVQLHEGDNRISLRAMIERGEQVDSVVTDAPYGLLSIQKRMGSEDAAPVKFGTDGAFARLSKGFFGKKWDGTGIERDPEFWQLIMGVLKPGGFVFACGGPRTIHRQIVAMEDAGFIIYPLHGWEYGTGLPKGKPSPRGESWKFGAGAPKIGFEPIVLAMKPLAEKGFKENIVLHGVGDLNIGGCRDDQGKYPSTVISVPEVVGDLVYHPKAGKSDRAGSVHPTVKPIALMQYLIRHITPPGGIILDPFAGSGTTAVAAQREGFDCILMEAEVEYINFLNARFNLNVENTLSVDEYDLSDLLN